MSEHHDIPKVTGFGIIVKFGTDFERHLGGTGIIRYLIYTCLGVTINVSEDMPSMFVSYMIPGKDAGISSMIHA